MKKQTKAPLIASLDDFTRHYIIAALWSSNDESTPSGGEPMDRNYSIEDMTIACLKTIQADCKRFQAENERALSLANYREGYYADGQSYTKDELAGHDFWLTRNHHGVGFWDRGLKLCLGKILTKAAESFGECHLYVQGGKVGIQ